MGKKLTQNDYKWMKRKNYSLWRSQLDISNFSDEERKLFLNFWRGRDFKDVPDRVFGELERFGFKKYLKKKFKVWVKVPFNADEYKFKTSEFKRSFEYSSDVPMYKEAGEIEIEFPVNCSMVTFSSNVRSSDSIEITESGSVLFNQGKFLEWSFSHGGAYFLDTNIDTPYENFKFEENKPSSEEEFKSFGVNATSYSEMRKQFKEILEAKVKEMNEIFEPFREEIRNKREEVYQKYLEKERTALESRKRADEELKESLNVPFLKEYNKDENLNIAFLINANEDYPDFPLIERIDKGYKFDRFLVYRKHNLRTLSTGRLELEKWNRVTIWVKPYKGIEDDFQDHLEETRKAWNEWVDKEAANHSFR